MMFTLNTTARRNIIIVDSLLIQLGEIFFHEGKYFLSPTSSQRILIVSTAFKHDVFCALRVDVYVVAEEKLLLLVGKIRSFKFVNV